MEFKPSGNFVNNGAKLKVSIDKQRIRAFFVVGFHFSVEVVKTQGDSWLQIVAVHESTRPIALIKWFKLIEVSDVIHLSYIQTKF